MTDSRIGVVLGSSRPGRLGERVCRFVMRHDRTAPAEFGVLDLADYRMPFFDEAVAPLDNPHRVPAPCVARWLEDMDAADGYLFLTPEYNFTIPAVLKNALDFLAGQASGKPAAILSYSATIHGGIVAGNELRLTLCKLGMLPLPGSLAFAHADRVLDEAGELAEDTPWAHRVNAFVPTALTELVRYTDALKPLRMPVP